MALKWNPIKLIAIGAAEKLGQTSRDHLRADHLTLQFELRCVTHAADAAGLPSARRRVTERAGGFSCFNAELLKLLD